GPAACQPFVDDDAQSILVTRDTWLAAYLFGSGIEDGALKLLNFLAAVAHAFCDDSSPEVAKHNLVLWADQHIMWFDITMDKAKLVNILECLGERFNIGDNRREW